MAILSLVGLGSFVATSLVIGLALLRRALRTRQVPEFAAGTAFTLCGGVGYLLMVVGRFVIQGQPALSMVFYAAGLLCLNLGSGCLALFVWRVFRPGAAGLGLLLLLSGLLAISYTGVAISSSFLVDSAGGGWLWLGRLTRTAVFLWVSAESFHLGRRLRDSADPLLIRQLRWWSLGAASAAAISGVHILRVLLGLGDPFDPRAALPVSLLGISAAGCLWKAFYGAGDGPAVPQLSQQPGSAR